MKAVKNNHNSIVRLLLEQPPVDLNCTCYHGFTALHLAATLGNAEGVRLLLADPRLNTVNLKDESGRTPVMLALHCALFHTRSADALRELVSHPSVDFDTSLEEKIRCGESLFNWML